VTQADELTEFDLLGGDRVFGRQPLQGVVRGEKIIIPSVCRCRCVDRIDRGVSDRRACDRVIGVNLWA
jgi:hypothetical protein